MKTLLLSNQKGGVGKSAIACQLAYYFAGRLDQRVLLIDLDHQANTTKSVKASGLASTAGIGASQVLTDKNATVEEGRFVLLPGDDQLMKLEKQAANHNSYASNLRDFVSRMADKFDVCIIDTNPNPDIRMVAALVASHFVLAPIQLNQEAIDGISKLITDVRNIKAKLNPNLHLIGLLPNQVVATPFQKANLEQLVAHFKSLLLMLPSGRPALIRSQTAIAEAQAEGKPVWKLGKTSARDAWREIEPGFQKIAADMGVL